MTENEQPRPRDEHVFTGEETERAPASGADPASVAEGRVGSGVDSVNAEAAERDVVPGEAESAGIAADISAGGGWVENAPAADKPHAADEAEEDDEEDEPAGRTIAARLESDGEVEFEWSAVGLVNAEEVELERSFAMGILSSGGVEIEQGGARSIVTTGSLEITQGGAGMILVGGDATITQGGAGTLVVLGSATIEQGGAAVLITPSAKLGNGARVGLVLSPRVEIGEGASVLAGPRQVGIAALIAASLAILVTVLRGISRR